MTTKAFFHQTAAYNAADLRWFIEQFVPYNAAGTVRNGLTVTNTAFRINVAAGHAFLGATNNIFAVTVDSTTEAVNESSGSAAWSPSSTTRCDVVYIKVTDASLDGSTNLARVEFKLGIDGSATPPSIPATRYVKLAEIVSSGGLSTTVITDTRKMLDSSPVGYLGAASDNTMISSPTTASQLGSCGVSVTVGAGRRLRISGMALLEVTQAPTSDFEGELRIYRDSTFVTRIGTLWQPTAAGGGGRAFASVSGFVIETPSAGTYNYNLRAGADQTSIFRVRGDGGQLTRILVEDIGPTS